MSKFFFVLLVKPLIVLGLAAAYYAVVYKPLDGIKKRMKDSRLKRFLFRRRGE